MNELFKRHRLPVGLGASLLLHGAIVLAWWLPNVWRPPGAPPPRQTLNLDLLGLLGDRQVDEQHALAPPQHAAPPRPTAAPAHRQRVLSQQRTEVVSTAPSPVQLTPEPAHPAPAAETQAPTPATPAVPPGQDAQTQTAQSVASREQIEAALMRQYLLALRKAVQAKLLYPSEAREAQWVGHPVIRFTITEDGNIVPGSLSVQQSSGHDVLDESALHAVQQVTAMPKPPRRMNVVIALSFEQAH